MEASALTLAVARDLRRPGIGWRVAIFVLQVLIYHLDEDDLSLLRQLRRNRGSRLVASWSRKTNTTAGGWVHVPIGIQ